VRLPGEVDPLITMYAENARVAAVFWDWRHKLITVGLTSLGALIVIAGWSFEHELGRWPAAPLAAGALVAFGVRALERRNHSILTGCYRVGSAIEKVWLDTPFVVPDDVEEAAAAARSPGKFARRFRRLIGLKQEEHADTIELLGGTFTGLYTARRSYRRVLTRAFATIAAVMLLAALWFVAWPPQRARDEPDPVNVRLVP
jgi:hypothetical protein